MPSSPHAAGRDTARAFLLAGVMAGPIYLVTGVAQGLLRDGFSFARHPLSVLANGEWGWVQTLNFVLCGALVVVAGLGVARRLGPGARATGVLLAGFGLGMLVSAVFPSDPMDGFPVGTPPGMPTSISPSGMGHIFAGVFTFLSLALSALVAWRALRARGDRAFARLSLVAGAVVLVGFFGGAGTGNVYGIWLAVLTGWAWIAALALRLREAQVLAASRP